MTETTPPVPSPGLARRLAALLYDSLLLVALWLATGALFLAISGGQLTAPDRPLWLLYGYRLALLGVTFGFYGWFWTHGGQTLGMRAWRLKLVSTDGGPVGWPAALRRFLAACVSLAALGLGFLWVVLDREHCAWHDRLSGTRMLLLPNAG